MAGGGFGGGNGRGGRGVYLSYEFLVHGGVAVGAVEGLLEEGEEDGDDDCGLDGLAEDDEEDGDGEDVGRHGCGCLVGAGRGGERRVGS